MTITIRHPQAGRAFPTAAVAALFAVILAVATIAVVVSNGSDGTSTAPEPVSQIGTPDGATVPDALTREQWLALNEANAGVVPDALTREQWLALNEANASVVPDTPTREEWLARNVTSPNPAAAAARNG